MTTTANKICFYCADQNPHRDRSRGITIYTRGLLTHLRAIDTLALSALTSKSSFPVPDGVKRITLPFPTHHLAGRLLADHFHPLMIRQDAFKIWHYPKGFLPRGFRVRAKTVGTVPDVMLQLYADRHPASRSRLAFAYWLSTLKDSLKKLDLILTVSEFSKQAILEFCARHRQRCGPIIVTYEGVEIEKRQATDASNKENYVVHLASKLPHKATNWLLKQWSLFNKELKDAPALKLVGDLDNTGTELFSKMQNTSLVPPLPTPDLHNLIAKGRALLLPSEIEGFGIPAVEAYQLGTPVAYVRDTAVEEIVGSDSPGGFKHDYESFRHAVLDVLEMDWSETEAKGQLLRRRFSWDECTARTLQAYRSLL